MQEKVNQTRFFFLCSALFSLNACGYHFQKTTNPLKNIGIHKIYVENFQNHTLRPGIEHAFTTAITREINISKNFKLTNNREEADAVLSGAITAAHSNPSTIQTKLKDDTHIIIANTFYSTITCQVFLKDKRGQVIFKRALSSGKSHPASLFIENSILKEEANRTTPTTNESAQRLTYQSLAAEMMANAYQLIVDIF